MVGAPRRPLQAWAALEMREQGDSAVGSRRVAGEAAGEVEPRPAPERPVLGARGPAPREPGAVEAGPRGERVRRPVHRDAPTPRQVAG